MLAYLAHSTFASAELYGEAYKAEERFSTLSASNVNYNTRCNPKFNRGAGGNSVHSYYDTAGYEHRRKCDTVENCRPGSGSGYNSQGFYRASNTNPVKRIFNATIASATERRTGLFSDFNTRSLSPAYAVSGNVSVQPAIGYSLAHSHPPVRYNNNGDESNSRPELAAGTMPFPQGQNPNPNYKPGPSPTPQQKPEPLEASIFPVFSPTTEIEWLTEIYTITSIITSTSTKINTKIETLTSTSTLTTTTLTTLTSTVQLSDSSSAAKLSANNHTRSCIISLFITFIVLAVVDIYV